MDYLDLLPIFDLEDEYILCVDSNGTEVVEPPLLETGLLDADYDFEWSLKMTLRFNFFFYNFCYSISFIKFLIVPNFYFFS